MPFVRRKTRRAPRKKPTGRRVTRVNRRRTRRAPRVPRAFGPFPRVMRTQLVYKNPSTNITSSGINSFNYMNLGLNNCYDFDTTNVLGNKQPLFFDQLCSLIGPYKNYKVNAWRTTIRFINLSDKPMFLYYDPSSTDLTQADSALEIENRRGVQTFMLTAQSNAKPMQTITKYQTLKQSIPGSVNQSENFSALYSAAPASPVYSTIGWKTIDGSTAAYTVAMQVQHIFYVELFNADSESS